MQYTAIQKCVSQFTMRAVCLRNNASDRVAFNLGTCLINLAFSPPPLSPCWQVPGDGFEGPDQDTCRDRKDQG